MTNEWLEAGICARITRTLRCNLERRRQAGSQPHEKSVGRGVHSPGTGRRLHDSRHGRSGAALRVSGILRSGPAALRPCHEGRVAVGPPTARCRTSRTNRNSRHRDGQGRLARHWQEPGGFAAGGRWVRDPRSGCRRSAGAIHRRRSKDECRNCRAFGSADHDAAGHADHRGSVPAGRHPRSGENHDWGRTGYAAVCGGNRRRRLLQRCSVGGPDGASAGGKELAMSRIYRTLDVTGPQELVFGRAPTPVRCGPDLVIGAGVVFPEVNFTLPAIEVNSQNWPEIVEHYHEMADNILKRAVALAAPGIVLEFELLPPMTENPEWGAELTALLNRHLLDVREKSGLRSALRVTPTDIREQGKPPLLRSGAPWAQLKRSFERCIQEGADIVSIESIGGKEVHDPALMYGDSASHGVRPGRVGAAGLAVAVAGDRRPVRGGRRHGRSRRRLRVRVRQYRH